MDLSECKIAGRDLPPLFPVAPEPLHGGRKNRSTVLAAVTALAPDSPEVILLELQGPLHLQIAEPPVTVRIVQVVGPSLQEHPQGLVHRFSDQGGVDVPPRILVKLPI